MNVYSRDLTLLGALPHTWETEPSGIILAEVSKNPYQLSLTYLGPQDLFARSHLDEGFI
jgi:hypothetical protein